MYNPYQYSGADVRYAKEPKPGPLYYKTFFSDHLPNLADNPPKNGRCFFVVAKCSENVGLSTVR